MERFTVRLDDDLAEWVEAESDDRGRSKAQIVAEAVAAAKGDESIYAVRTDAHRTAPVQSGADSTDPVQGGADRTEPVRDRLEAIEDRLAALEDARDTPTAQNASDSPECDSSTETMNTPLRERNEAGSGPADPREGDTVLSPEWILEHAAWADHEVTPTEGRAAALADAHATVAIEDDVTSGQLAEGFAADDRVGLSEGTVRNHLLPVLGALPGMVQPASGQRVWRYEGDYSTNS